MKELYTEIEIESSAEKVWQVLTSFEKYPEWNPFIKKIIGKAEKGTTLEVHMPDPQGGTIIMTPTVLVADKQRELAWLGKMEGRDDLFTGEHHFLIEPLAGNKIRFIHSERFAGVMVPKLEGWLDTAVKSHFEAMNKAIKNRAEKE